MVFFQTKQTVDWFTTGLVTQLDCLEIIIFVLVPGLVIHKVSHWVEIHYSLFSRSLVIFNDETNSFNDIEITSVSSFLIDFNIMTVAYFTSCLHSLATPKGFFDKANRVKSFFLSLATTLVRKFGLCW